MDKIKKLAMVLGALYIFLGGSFAIISVIKSRLSCGILCSSDVGGLEYALRVLLWPVFYL